MILIYFFAFLWLICVGFAAHIIKYKEAMLIFYELNNIIYWMRANDKWEAYKAHSVASNLQKLLDVIKEDKYHCFFG
jgi:hypothetical protein